MKCFGGDEYVCTFDIDKGDDYLVEYRWHAYAIDEISAIKHAIRYIISQGWQVRALLEVTKL